MAGPNSPSADYFNDLSRQSSTQRETTTSQSQSGTSGDNNNDNNNNNDGAGSGAGAGSAAPQNQNEGGAAGGDSSYIPRTKRIACVVCRKRKLRCDGKKPSCGTCSRLGHDCAYDEVRKKSGPKRGYVKQLEARLAQVETLLRSQEPESLRNQVTQPQQQQNSFSAPIPNDALQGMPDISMLPNDLDTQIQSLAQTFGQQPPGQPGLPGADLGFNGEFPWEMVSLGLEEPLPAQDVVDELHQTYFEKIHPSIPIIHRPRYLATMSLAPNMRPPVCLRYIIWCLAASVSNKYSFLQEHFYQRARKYAEIDEMKGHGEHMITVAHCQCWSLIALYEFKMMYFPRAWISTGRASRLALMMGLHRLDGLGLDVKQCLPPPRDWTEREERRRAFWTAFCQDRYASIGTGWPMMLDERDILTNLPATEEAYVKSKPQQTPTLSEVLAGEGASALSPFGGVVLMACIFGRNLTHLHRPDPHDNDGDLNGEFWKRHRTIDNILLHTSLSLPSQLRLPSGISDANIVFCNMCIHTSTICLHQAAIFKAEKNQMPNQIIAESKRRCIIAADQIASIMKMVSHMDLSAMNPFVAFCLYVAARVFVQYLKSRPEDQTVRSSLQFLLSALNALKHKNPLTESFLVQLDVDLEGSGLETPDIGLKTSCPTKKGACTLQPRVPLDDVECSPLLTIRQSQSSGAVLESPLQDATPVDLSGTSYVESGYNLLSTAPLPSRQKQPGVQQSNTTGGFACDLQGLQSSRNPTPGTDESGQQRPHIDMDFSIDMSLSDRNQSSDHPTPSTLNSSSNTSFTPSRTDHPSPQKQQQSNIIPSSQYPQTSVANVANPISMSPNSAAYLANVQSFNDQYFGPLPDTPQDTGGTGNPFAMTSAWEYPVSTTSTANIDTAVGGEGGTGMTPLGDNNQWTQIFDGTGWENWRT